MSSMERAGVRRELSASKFSSSTGSDRLVPTIPLLVVAIAEQPGGSLAITLWFDNNLLIQRFLANTHPILVNKPASFHVIFRLQARATVSYTAGANAYFTLCDTIAVYNELIQDKLHQIKTFPFTPDLRIPSAKNYCKSRLDGQL